MEKLSISAVVYSLLLRRHGIRDFKNMKNGEVSQNLLGLGWFARGLFCCGFLTFWMLGDFRAASSQFEWCDVSVICDFFAALSAKSRSV